MANHLSAPARDLIERILVVEPMKRFGIVHIRTHPWMRTGLTTRAASDQWFHSRRQTSDTRRRLLSTCSAEDMEALAAAAATARAAAAVIPVAHQSKRLRGSPKSNLAAVLANLVPEAVDATVLALSSHASGPLAKPQEKSGGSATTFRTTMDEAQAFLGVEGPSVATAAAAAAAAAAAVPMAVRSEEEERFMRYRERVVEALTGEADASTGDLTKSNHAQRIKVMYDILVHQKYSASHTPGIAGGGGREGAGGAGAGGVGGGGVGVSGSGYGGPGCITPPIGGSVEDGVDVIDMNIDDNDQPLAFASKKHASGAGAGAGSGGATPTFERLQHHHQLARTNLMPKHRRKWYVGIRSKMEAPKVMTRVLNALAALNFEWTKIKTLDHAQQLTVSGSVADCHQHGAAPRRAVSPHHATTPPRHHATTPPPHHPCRLTAPTTPNAVPHRRATPTRSSHARGPRRARQPMVGTGWRSTATTNCASN